MEIARAVIPLLVLLWPSPCPAQAPASPTHGTEATKGPRDLFGNVGVWTTDAGIVGAGPGYEVRFGATEVAVVPELGNAAAKDQPFAYRLIGVGRGASVEPARESATPEIAGNTVRCRRGHVTENYELQSRGVEQSFVLDSLPGGTGDLVVRGRITTDLLPTFLDATELRFELPGVGGVRVGAVVGIDATGARVDGELRWHDGELDYVLPEAFVRTAVLPLVVDPLIGPLLHVSTGGFDRSPDIAYDATNDLYLVVFRTFTSATNQNVYGQRFTATTFVGGLIGLETASGTLPTDPCVANIAAADAFVVAWHLNGDVLARGVNAGTGTVTSQVSVASGTDVQIEPDLAGESGPTQIAAVCVWTNRTTSDIQARHLIWSSGSLLVGLVVTTFANPVSSPYSAPCISQHHGASGRRLICWERFVSIGTANQAIVGVVVDRNLATVAGPTLFFNNSIDEHDPDCDGDGDQWVVAFERDETVFPRTDVLAVPLHLAGTTLVAGAEEPVSAMLAYDERDPSVGWLRESCLVAWSRESAPGNGDFDTWVKSIDPLDCEGCEGTAILQITADAESDTAIAWRLGNGLDDEAMIAWASNLQVVPFPGTPSIKAKEYRADDGRVTSAGVGCGTGGDLRTKCARPGTVMSLSLFSAAPAAAALLVLATSRADYPCGSCVLVPDPWLGFVGSAAATNSFGDTAAEFALPLGTSGAAFYAQYVTAGGTCFGGFSLSNALLVNVQ